VESPNHRSLGHEIRLELLSQQLTVTQLADDIGVSRQTIYNWINGKNRPRWTHLVALSESLAMPMHRLIGAPTSWGEPCQVF